MKRYFRDKVEKAIEEFNKYRSPEATSKLISGDGSSYIIKFTGPFCATCGFYDYFDGLRIILEGLKLKSEIVEIEEIDEGTIIKLKVG